MIPYKKWCPICRHNKNNVCDFENCFSNNVDSDYKTICRWFDDRVKLNCQISFLGELKKYIYEPPALSNNYKCPRCGARVKLPIDAPGQLELFPPNCHNCGSEMRPDNDQ